MTYVTNDMPLAKVLENDPGVANILFDTVIHSPGCALPTGKNLPQPAQVHGGARQPPSTPRNTTLSATPDSSP